MSIKNDRAIKRYDFILIFTTIALVFIGIVMVKSTTMSLPGGGNSQLKRQIFAFLLGTVVVIILAFIDYEIYGYFYIPIYVISNLLLIAVLFFGYGAEQYGNSNWLSIGPINFQPSEVAKLGVIISLAKFIDINKDKINQPFTLLKILAFAFLPVFLIYKEPDYGTAIVYIFFIMVMLYASGLSYKYITPVIILGIIAVIGGLIFLTIYMKDYEIGTNFRLDRIMMFLHPELDPTDKGYQVYQSKIAIGSGQLFGRGLFQGIQNQYNFLPEKQTDFIFAIIGEELGFVGGVSVLFLYMVMMFRFIKIAKNSRDLFGSLIVIGILGMFLFHIIENIGMTMGLLPVTGIPLPFVSYGGTFMLINTICIGLILQVGLQCGKQDFYN